MNRDETMRRIEEAGVVAVIRADDSSTLIDLIESLLAGGVTACEVTMTVPGALEAISQASKHFGDRALVGVGSVLDAETARLAVLAGASFIFSPILDPGVIEMGHRYGRPVVPGAFTPTEILSAWTAGADAVKVFPANHLGPKFFSDILAPMPQLRLTPTGGVDLDSTPDWIRAGAFAVGAGSSLVRANLLKARDWSGISDLARTFIETVATTRREMT